MANIPTNDSYKELWRQLDRISYLAADLIKTKRQRRTIETCPESEIEKSQLVLPIDGDEKIAYKSGITKEGWLKTCDLHRKTTTRELVSALEKTVQLVRKISRKG